MKLYFPKLSLGSKKLGKPGNPFTTRAVTIKLPALKSTPLLRKRFKVRSPFTKA